jgi:hypothetical protein
MPGPLGPAELWGGGTLALGAIALVQGGSATLHPQPTAAAVWLEHCE